MADDKNAKIFGDPPASPPAKKQQTGASSNPNGAAPRIENGNIHGLPRMLSPTLPPSVEEQLAQLRGGEALSAKRARTATSEKRSAKPMVNGRVVADKPKPRPEAQGKEKGPETEEKRKASNRQSSAFATSSASSLSKATERQGKHQGKIEAPLKSKAGTVDIGKGLDSGAEPNGKDRPSGDASRKINQNDQPSLIVRLKIPKSLRKNCQRILQMQPRPRKLPGSFQMTPSSGPQDQSKERPSSNGSATGQAQQRKTNSGENSQGRSEAASKPKAVANGPSTPKPGEKRRQPDEDKDSSGQTSKRQRLSGAELQKPSTPQTSSLKSPNLPQSSSSQKARLSTPKNDLKSAAMRRIGSTEGEVKTPLGSIRSNTPTAPNSADRSGNRDGRSTSNVSSASTSIPTNKNDEGAFYKCEFTKHADLARSLKRAADALAKSKGGQINTDSVARREGLAIAIETTLCYMLAFTLKDESDRIKRLPNDRAAWVTLLPYFRFLKSLLRDDDSPHLQGFLYQLEAVCRETILQHDLERLEREPAAADEDSATFRKQMAENGKAVTQCWIDGSNLLSTEDLQEEYPDTWNKRSKGSLSSRGKEKLVPKRYGDGGFHLPLSNTSTSIEAVRAGWSFLAEWCKKEGVQWEGKMGL